MLIYIYSMLIPFFSIFSVYLANYNFLHLTDIHLDLDYKVGSPNHCLLGSTGLGCCRVNMIGNGSAGKWGDNNCDSPPILLNMTLDWISKNEDLDFILYSGDSVGHHDLLQSPKKNLDTIKIVTEMFATYFEPNSDIHSVKIIPNQGNHDTYPIDQTIPILEKTMRKQIANLWKPWLGIEISDQFMETGYFGLEVFPNIWVYSLDSLDYDSRNLFRNKGISQEEWLNSSLAKVREMGGSVLLLGHIFPTAGESTTIYNHWLLSYLEEYNDIIVGSLFGHSHKDEFKIGKGIEPILVTPSLMPDKRDPCFRLYQLSNSVLLGYRQYCINLLETNRNDKLIVYLDYDTRTEYGLKNMSGDNYREFYKLLVSDHNMSEKYCRHYYHRLCSKSEIEETMESIYIE